MPPFDLKRLTLSNVGPSNLKPSTRLPRHKGGQKFIKGPIPLVWIQAAAKGGRGTKALHVALALWFRAGLENCRVVKLTRSVLQPLGVSPDAARRGLQALEAATLVTVERKPGCCPVVTLLDGPTDHA